MYVAIRDKGFDDRKQKQIRDCPLHIDGLCNGERRGGSHHAEAPDLKKILQGIFVFPKGYCLGDIFFLLKSFGNRLYNVTAF